MRATSSQILKRSVRRRRFWEPNRKPGFWSACEHRRPPGRFGEIRWRHFRYAWIRRTCPKESRNHGTATDLRHAQQRLQQRLSRAREIYDFISMQGITGFTTVSGDRHSFWAGLAAATLPPKTFQPVGLAFVTGSISAPGTMEAQEYNFPKTHVPAPIVCSRDQHVGETRSAILPGIRTKRRCHQGARVLQSRSGAACCFRRYGWSRIPVVRAAKDALETEFVCIPRPLERSDRVDGGPLNYGVRAHARLWSKGEHPALTMESSRAIRSYRFDQTSECYHCRRGCPPFHSAASVPPLTATPTAQKGSRSVKPTGTGTDRGPLSRPRGILFR